VTHRLPTLSGEHPEAEAALLLELGKVRLVPVAELDGLRRRGDFGRAEEGGLLAIGRGLGRWRRGHRRRHHAEAAPSASPCAGAESRAGANAKGGHGGAKSGS
jgi:hypothetical protein